MSASPCTAYAPSFSAMATNAPVLRSVTLQRATSGGLKRSRSVGGKSEKYMAGSETVPSYGAFSMNNSWREEPAAHKEAETNVGGSWKVLDDDVPAVPPHFPIMATHVTVQDESATVIAERVERCLCEWSIAARYNSRKAKIVAETANRVRFCVRMFRDDDGCIIVEVQRRTSGGCLGFHDAALAILRAAQNLDFTRNGLRRVSPMELSADSPIRQEAEELNSEYTQPAKGALGCAARLLTDPRADAQLLGAESLHLLTDTNTMGGELATAAARKVLSSKEVDPRSCHVADGQGDALGEEEEDGGPVDITAAVKRMVELTIEDGEDSDDELEDGPLGRYIELVHGHGLSILTNSVAALSRSGEMKAIMENDEWYEEKLIRVLVREMSHASRRPHDASVALRCLALLTETSDDFRAAALREGVSQQLAIMHNSGVCRNYTLVRRELERALVAFDNASTNSNVAVQ